MRTQIFRTVAWAIIVVGVFALHAAAQDLDLEKAPRITLAEFKKLYDAHDVVIVDVRDEGSFKNGHIPGALLVPLDQLAAKAPQLKAENKPVVTYCAWPAEHTSARAALELAGMGVKNVRALKGGWVDWRLDKNPIEKGEK